MRAPVKSSLRSSAEPPTGQGNVVSLLILRTIIAPCDRLPVSDQLTKHLVASHIKNLISIDGSPPKRLRCEIKVALLAEEAARVARKSSCTAQSCYQQQWTANRQTEYTSMEAS
ncbi:hypothetical protein [Microcoleus sp. D2_18a_D3]|uniref:hypothetical protein n=1 Tax=Microcoleus sp. D2_18a_D3 TaxID=3055330 RepID=UPI002FD260A3